MADIETAERLARLETQHTEIVRLMREAHDDMQELKRDLHDVKNSLTRWMGIGAGVAITISLLWTAAFSLYKLLGGK
jgi:hypothetical protein